MIRGESVTRKKGYWKKAIAAAEKSGEFTLEDYKKSASWVTCACGEQDHVLMFIGRDRGPWDSTLDGLGMAFFNAINSNQPKRARDLLETIQIRADSVLSQVAKMTTKRLHEIRAGNRCL